MSSPAPAVQEDNKEQESILPERIDKGSWYLEKQDFKGENSKYLGLTYWKAQVKTPEAAVEKYGAKAVVDLVNQGLNVAIKNKAKAQVAGETDKETQQEIEDRISRGDLELISSAEAEAFVPGSREVNSMSGINKKIDEAVKAYREAKAASNTEVMADLKNKIEVLRSKRTEIEEALVDMAVS